MCANCVSSVDATVAALGGAAGLRVWLGARFQAFATPRRKRILGVALAAGAILVAGGLLGGTG